MPEVTYRVSRIAHVVHSSLLGLCSLFHVPNCTFVVVFLPPSEVNLVSIGTVRISTDLVSVMVFGRWLLLA